MIWAIVVGILANSAPFLIEPHVSLLLKALSPKGSRLSSQRDALLLREEEFRNRAQGEAKPPSEAEVATEIAAEDEYFDEWTRLDPAEYISGETAIIEPFEPFEQTATEFLPTDALPDFDKLEAERLAAAVEESTVAPIEEPTVAPISDEVEPVVEVVAEPEHTPSPEDIIPSALARLEELHRLIQRDREETAARVEPIAVAVVEPDIVVAPPEPSPLPAPPKLPLREEYRELRDHLLTRFPLTKPATILVVDAGRITHDASWLAPLAASIIQYFSETANRTPKVLIVEAVGPECSVARGMGLQCASGLADALQNRTTLAAAITPTEHPQIQLLARGNGPLGANDRERLAKLWPDLQQQFDLILIAAGTTESTTVNSRQSNSVADFYLPLADGVILSVELEGTPRNVANVAHRRLAARGAKLIGCVVHGDAA